MARWSRRSVLAAGLALGACAVERPPLDRVYPPRRHADAQPPLVFIPGAFGSTLRDRRTGLEVWPVSDSELLLGNYRHLELPIDHRTLEPLEDGIEAYAVLREGLGRDFYGEVVAELQQVGGYRRARAGQRPLQAGGNLYPFLYDFRLDNIRAARALDQLIQQIRIDHGDPTLKVDILAHSNGGLVARYYARYGAAELPDTGDFRPTQAGAANIRKLLLAGTPNLGTMQPVLSLLRGEEIGLRNIPPEVVATCTGLPQMLPHPRVPWLADLDGVPIEADLYDVETWRDFRWSLFDPRIAARTIAQHGGGAEGERYLAVLREYLARHLRRGARFSESLTAGAEPVRPWVFGGDCELTLSRLVLESVRGIVQARERPQDIVAPRSDVDYESVMYEPGDTVVTRSSLLGRGGLDETQPRHPYEVVQVAHSVFLCERHQQLTGNPTFLDNLLHALFDPTPA